MISSVGSKAISSPLRPPRPLVSTTLTRSATSRTASVRLADCFPSRTAYPAAVSAATRAGVTPTRARTPIVMSAPSKPKRIRHHARPAWHHDKNSRRDTLRRCTVMSFVVTSAADRTQSRPASLSAFLCGGLGDGRSAATLLTPSASPPPLPRSVSSSRGKIGRSDFCTSPLSCAPLFPTRQVDVLVPAPVCLSHALGPQPMRAVRVVAYVRVPVQLARQYPARTAECLRRAALDVARTSHRSALRLVTAHRPPAGLPSTPPHHETITKWGLPGVMLAGHGSQSW